MKVNQKVVTKTIQNLEHLAVYDVIKYVEEMVLEGWRVPSNTTNKTFPMKYGDGWYVIHMVKEEAVAQKTEQVEENKDNQATKIAPVSSKEETPEIEVEGVVEAEETPDEVTEPPVDLVGEVEEEEVISLDLETLSKKAELLEYAEAKGIVVPEEIKIPSAIKKFLQNQEEVINE